MRRIKADGGQAEVRAEVLLRPKREAPGEPMRGDAFAVEISAGQTVVYADSKRERLCAGEELARLRRHETAPCGLYRFEPDFQTRGVIEGFYGKPWSMAARREILGLMARHGMNEYFYGPKDDPFHRDRWRELYGDGEDAVLRELIDIAGENGLEFRYLLAPGLDIRYTSEEDRTALARKYAQVYSFGVRRFGLLLDDLERASLYAEDAAVYPKQVDAHIALTNRVYRDLKALDPSNTLIVCPTQYWGPVDGPYVTALGRGIPAGVGLFFTGGHICSDRLTAAEAEAFATATGHRPMYWDNYPVNDAEMADELHLAPYTGREPALSGVCEGVVLNPMEFARASLIPLLTAADFLFDSEGYDPETSFDRAVAEVLGEAQIAPVRRLSEFCWKSCLTRNGYHYRYDAPAGANRRFEAALAAGPDALLGYVRESAALFEALERCGDAAFLSDCRRWLDACKAFCGAAETGLTGGGAAELKRYLYRNEDVMKPEALRVIRLIESEARR